MTQPQPSANQPSANPHRYYIVRTADCIRHARRAREATTIFLAAFSIKPNADRVTRIRRRLMANIELAFSTNDDTAPFCTITPPTVTGYAHFTYGFNPVTKQTELALSIGASDDELDELIELAVLAAEPPSISSPPIVATTQVPIMGTQQARISDDETCAPLIYDPFSPTSRETNQ